MTASRPIAHRSCRCRNEWAGLLSTALYFASPLSQVLSYRLAQGLDTSREIGNRGRYRAYCYPLPLLNASALFNTRKEFVNVLWQVQNSVTDLAIRKLACLAQPIGSHSTNAYLFAKFSFG